MGKAMLAFLPDDIREEILSKIRYTRYTSKTLCTREALLKSLERVKKRGFAIDDEEIEVGVRCVGAPVFDKNHHPIAAVSVSGPASRITVQSVPGIAERLVRCCNEISRSLGIHERRRSKYSSPLFHHYGN
jgi:DNA-binding IclR family transcriptional regulator